MKNYQKLMEEVDSRLNKSIPKVKSSGFMAQQQGQPPVKNNDVIDSIASYIGAIRKTKQELLNGK